MNDLGYFAPTCLSEALRLLGEVPDARVLAGGTDLIAKWKKSHFFDMNLVDIRNVPELSVIEDRAGGFFIGAGVTMDRINEDADVMARYPILGEAAGKVGSVQIRNLATIGGNSCNAAPSADTVLPLIVYGAEAVIISPLSERRCPLATFFNGPGKTVLEKGELLMGFFLPTPSATASAYFVKHSRRPGMDLATVGIAMLLDLSDTRISEIRAVLGAVGPIPICVKGLEAFCGSRLDEDIRAGIVAACAAAASPITDVRGSKEYRDAMVRRSVSLCIDELSA